MTAANLDGLLERLGERANTTSSLPEKVLELEALAAIRELRALVKDYEEVNADKKRLVRELDVILNGEEGAAQQASLCDIVGQAASEQRKSSAPLFLELDSLRAEFSACQKERDDAKHQFDISRLADKRIGELIEKLVTALREIADMDSAECARDPFLCKARARAALAGKEGDRP